ncbi:MAG: serine/threonine-protein kinase, partial [Polyangiales bacterium]
MTASGCLTEHELVRYVTSAAGDLDLQPFDRHIDECELCRRNIAGLVRANRDSAPRLASGISDGVSIGRYVIRAATGTGAMGHVFEAQDPDLGRAIAIKIVHSREASADTRALREGRALARLTHPNVVAVYDVGIWSGGVFLAMELVRGATLRTWAATPRSWRDVVRMFEAVARGLQAAHAAGLVHRDVKPDNLVVGDDGRVRVIDFGLAADETGDGPVVAGTPAYMAPEQQRAGVADARSDQYAFMVALFETLEGARPGRDLAFERTPSWLRTLIRRGLREQPADRHPDMAAIAHQLHRGLGRRRRFSIAAGSLAVVAGVAAVALRQPAAAAPSCDGGPRLAGIWDPPRKQIIKSALLATSKPYA